VEAGVLKLTIWNAREPRDREQWIARHASSTSREVFAHPDYVSLFAREEDTPTGIYAEGPDGFVLYPTIVRPLEGGASDLTSPYGYGGAFVSGSFDATDDFWKAFEDWARSRSIVSEFLRFSLFSDQLLAYPGTSEIRLMNVVRDLTGDEAAMWTEFDHKVRKNVNKARREGVTIEIDPEGARLDDFLRIYTSTMDRRAASKGFYFGREFFEKIVRTLKGQFVFAHALHDNRVISTELALVSAHHIYSFLGGTDETAFSLRPNDLLKLELMRWGKEHGKRAFVLGGGYAPDDGIFKYKRGFAPDGLLPFSTGMRVLDADRYATLVASHESRMRAQDASWQPAPGFFPGYRA